MGGTSAVTVYQIAHWPKYFENNKSKSIKTCSHVFMPNKQDGLTFSRLMAHPQGTTIFGIWCLILQACSRQGVHRNGWLTDDGTEKGTPWTPEDLAFRWRRPLAEISTAIEFLCSDRIGWIKRLAHKCPSQAPDAAPHRPSTYLTEHTEQNIPHTDTTGDERLAETGSLETKSDEFIFELGNKHTRWRVTDTDASADNRETLIFLFRSHPELAKALAEGHHFQTGKKINVWELEDMIAEPSSPVPHDVIAGRLIAKHGWQACRDAVKLARPIENENQMASAMIANGTILDAVVAKLGVA
jgi:hypothetical protein